MCAFVVCHDCFDFEDEAFSRGVFCELSDAGIGNGGELGGGEFN